MEACIKREEGLYQFLISLFPKMTQEELGCKDPDKFKMGKDLIKKVENCTGRPPLYFPSINSIAKFSSNGNISPTVSVLTYPNSLITLLPMLLSLSHSL